MNIVAIGFLIYGFCVNCLFLYVGTFFVIFSEISLWFSIYKMINEKPLKNKKGEYQW